MKRAVILLALFACQQHPKPRLFTDEELAAYEQDLAHRLAANAAQKCSPDIVALIEPKAADGDALVAHVVAAAQSRCSPYQVGGRLVPSPPKETNDAANKLGERITEIAVTDPARAAALAAQAIRLYQDFGRGHVTLETRGEASAYVEMIANRLDPIIGTLTPAQAAALAPALEQLVANDPPIGDALEGDREQLESRPFRGEHFGDPRDEAALMFAIGAAWARMNAAACPASATLEQCATALKAPHGKPANFASFGQRFATGEDREAIRREMATAEPGRPPFWTDYLDDAVEQLAHLAKLQAHVERVRRGR